MHVLVVEDEPALRSFLAPLLDRNGFEVTCAEGGAEALAAVARRRPDLVLLDVTLPDISGLDVCRELRRLPGYLPVIMLTGRAGRDDELAGFAAAADDYVTKPFDPEALVARIRATLRLANGLRARQLRVGPVVIDLAAREVRRDGRPVPLPPRAFDLLAFLAEHPGQVFGKTQLLDRVWGPDFTGDPHTVAVRFSQLRAVVEPNPNRPRYLITRHGVGYLLRPDGAP